MKPELKICDIDEECTWDDWLILIENKLKELDYKKYIQHYKSEDFMYWKNFSDRYLVGLAFYDFRKYNQTDPNAYRIGIQFECELININDRFSLTVSKNIPLEEFEKISFSFFEAMYIYLNK